MNKNSDAIMEVRFKTSSEGEREPACRDVMMQAVKILDYANDVSQPDS
jgi:hypothetical protein